MSTPAFAIISAALQLDAGILSAGAASAAASATRAQGEIAAIEAESAAKQTEREGEKVKATQVMAFTANGVRLTGTPLLVLAETALNAEIEASSIRRQGEARQQLAEASADAQAASGITNIIGGISGAAQTTGLFLSRRDLVPAQSPAPGKGP